ncbi:MAG: CDP-glycerol glycerophosphotransferase family protein [Candidatus Cloacimonetes bacterium]|nr:CDP-glycerol glycerophosphotransferase family protein [Candidatus Cloacimonadota bacterium]
MRYLFYISKKYSIPIVKPLSEYLKKMDHEFAFYVSEKVNKNIPDEWKEFLIMNEIDKAINYHPDFVIVPGNFVDPRIPGIKVQIFHGLGIEKKSHYKIRHFFDVYGTSGPFITERYKKLQKRYKYFLVQETGWPKIDHILNYPTENLKKKLNIPKGKKIILFAPTHSRKMQSAEELLPIIPKIVNEDEIWFVKFHELMDKNLIRNFTVQTKEKVRITDDPDITPYLHLADVLISDTSSVVYEFMVLDKPVITFETINRKDKGINIIDPDDLRKAIDRSLENPGEFSSNRKKHLEEINPYLNGKISERLINILLEIKEKDLLPKKRMPLNLFRKLQIIHHRKFRKGYLR